MLEEVGLFTDLVLGVHLNNSLIQASHPSLGYFINCKVYKSAFNLTLADVYYPPACKGNAYIQITTFILGMWLASLIPQDIYL